MYNPGEDDNELDRLSREAAAGYKAPGGPDWNAMQERLDKIMPEEKKKRRFFLFWWLLPALLLGGFAYYKMDQAPLTAAPDTNNSIVMPTPKDPKDVVTATNAPSVDKAVVVPVKKENNIELVASETSILSTRKKSLLMKAPLQSGAPVFSNTTPAGSDIQKSNLVVGDTKPADQLIAEVKPEEIKPTDIKETVASPVTTEQTPVSAVAESPVVTTTKKAKNSKAWSIGVLGSIDESTVKFTYGYEPGYGLGVLAGYHFNKTFSLHSGAIYTQKNYKMAGADFHAPKGTWASYYNLETVDGYCRMWEVPLLARFYTMHTDKKGLFLSTGISSYFMTSEKYTYDYHYMGAPATRTLDYTSSTNHLLSIVHLSAGFESTVGKNLYLQIEPYAKIPLGGVGTGSIQLSSFGVNLGVQMRKSIKK